MKARSLKDNIQIDKRLSFNRSVNLIKLYSGFFLSRFLKKRIQLGRPFSLDFEPTTSCNECPSGLREFSRPTGMLNKYLLLITVFHYYICLP